MIINADNYNKHYDDDNNDDNDDALLVGSANRSLLRNGLLKNYLRTSARPGWTTHRGSDPGSKTDEHQATQHSTAQCLKEDLGGRHAHHKGHMPYHVGENVAAREPNSPQMPKPKAKQQRQTAPACHSMHNRKKTVRGNLHTASCNKATTAQRGLPRQVFSSGTAKSGPIGQTDKGRQKGPTLPSN